MERKTLYLIRHGESVYNKEGIIQGSINTSLTGKGKDDAREAGKKLKEYGIKHIAHSPLERAQQTAEAINESLNVPITIWENLKEMYFGQWAAETKIEHWVPFRTDFYQHGMAPPGGESKRGLFERGRGELIRICNEVDEHPILVVAHGMIMRILIGEWFTNSSEKDIRALQMPNLAMYEVDVEYDKENLEPKSHKFHELI